MYAGAVKGVLLSGCPQAQVVDLTHEIAPGDVLEGALFLARTLPLFPPGTVHVAVVDPGVGTERRPIAVSAAGSTIVCPDNGLLTMLTREHPVDEAREIASSAFRRDVVSTTFHGRDIFAPAAARLACGAPLAEIGPVVDEIVALPLPEARRDGERVRGEIIHVDRYGNAITNIHRSLLGSTDGIAVRVGSRVLRAVDRTFADVEPGEPLAYFESSDQLAIAINGGSAAERLGLRRGDAVDVERA